MFNNSITTLKVWCQKVLPLVYDDSLSYYELLCKVVAKVNEVVESMNDLNKNSIQLINEIMQGWLDSGVIEELINENILNDIKAKIQANTEAISVINDTTIPGVEQKITDLRGTVNSNYADLDGKITTLSSTVSNNYNSLLRLINANDAEINAIKEFNITVSSDIEELKNNIASLTLDLKYNPTDWFNVKKYGAKGDGITDDYNAISEAITEAMGGCGIVYFPKGTYNISKTIDITGLNGLSFIGDNQTATVIQSTNDNLPIIKTNADSTTYYNVFKNITFTSSIGKVINTDSIQFKGGMKRLLIEDCTVKNWYNGIRISAYEVCWFNRLSVVMPAQYPTESGTGIIIGDYADTSQGANLIISDCFLRGSRGDEGVGDSNYATTGVAIHDCDAVFMYNTDIGAFLYNDMVIDPNSRCNNHHFLQCYFDATTYSDCIKVMGTGTFAQITFNGCWIASAGSLYDGDLSAKACGLNVERTGANSDIIITGCRFFNIKGVGLRVITPGFYALVSSCFFNSVGISNTPNYNHGIYLDTVTNNYSINVDNCVFDRIGGDCFFSTPKSSFYTVTNCKSVNGTYTFSGKPLKVSGNISALKTVKSANSITVPINDDLCLISGNTNILHIDPAYNGKTICLLFTDSLTVASGQGNLRLQGNFTTSNLSLLFLMCYNNEWIEIARSNYYTGSGSSIMQLTNSINALNTKVTGVTSITATKQIMVKFTSGTGTVTLDVPCSSVNATFASPQISPLTVEVTNQQNGTLTFKTDSSVTNTLAVNIIAVNG